MNETQAKSELCGEPMPPGEEMFKFHGYSCDCPKPPLAKNHDTPVEPSAPPASPEIARGYFGEPLTELQFSLKLHMVSAGDEKGRAWLQRCRECLNALASIPTSDLPLIPAKLAELEKTKVYLKQLEKATSFKGAPVCVDYSKMSRKVNVNFGYLILAIDESYFQQYALANEFATMVDIPASPSAGPREESPAELIRGVIADPRDSENCFDIFDANQCSSLARRLAMKTPQEIDREIEPIRKAFLEIKLIHEGYDIRSGNIARESLADLAIEQEPK